MKRTTFFFTLVLVTILTSTIVSCIPTTPTTPTVNCFNAVACYPFNGNANDASGNGHNGTIVGAALSTGRKGTANSAYYFRGYNSGTPDYIDLPTLQSINNSEEISISMWLKVDSSKQTGGTPFTMMPDAAGDRLNAHINYLPFQLVQDNGDIFGTGRVFQYRANSFNWDHYVFVKSATNNKMQVYLNNVLVINENKHDNISNKNKTLRLGGGAGNTEYFAGWMDDVRIFNTALSATEVNSLYTE